MLNKLARLVVLAPLAVLVLPACASASDPFESAESEEPENLGQTSQAYCLGGPGSPPTPVAYVPGFGYTISSGTYNYGSAACNGYPVRFTGLTDTKGYKLEIHVGDSPTKSMCNNTSMTVWVWHRYNGSNSWTYAGTATDDAWWSDSVHNCLHLFKFGVDGPKGSYDVLVKAQARSETTGGGIGYAFNRPVTVKAAPQ